MYCPKCGNKITDTAKFCPACGETVVNDNKIKQTSPDKSDNMKDKILTIAISVAGVLIIVMAIVSVGRSVMKRNNFLQNDIPRIETPETEPQQYQISISEETQSSVSVGKPEPAETLPVESTFGAYETSDSAQEQEQPVNLDEEITQIREWFYWTQDNLGNMMSEDRDGIIYVSDAGAVRKVTVPAGVDATGYSREYYFVDDRLYFAFVYKKSAENRFYFSNDRLIRYIDENRETHDLEAADAYADEASGFQKEAYALIGQEFDPLLGSGFKAHTVQNDMWKQAYKDYIRQHSNNVYSLFYMDDDDIPELLVWDGDSSGSIVTADNRTGKYDESEDLGLFYEPEYKSGVCFIWHTKIL